MRGVRPAPAPIPIPIPIPEPASEPVRLLVVAKAPVAGQAKTRLIPALGPVGAAEAAAAALLDTLDAVVVATRTPGAFRGLRPLVAMTGDLDRAARSPELRSALRWCDVIPQRGSGFADRLVAAHEDAGPGAVIQIGMDTPQVTPGLLATCAAELLQTRGDHAAGDRPDAVVGPADDGGWWLLGVRAARHARALARVPMSRADTGRLTVEALRADGLQVRTVPGLRDVDTIDDAHAVAALAPGTRFAATIPARAVLVSGGRP